MNAEEELIALKQSLTQFNKATKELAEQMSLLENHINDLENCIINIEDRINEDRIKKGLNPMSPEETKKYRSDILKKRIDPSIKYISESINRTRNLEDFLGV